MFCAKCGNQIAESTAFCPKCGAAASGNVSATNTSVPNHMIGAILSLLCCLTGGIIACVYVCMANKMLKSGDVEGARKASIAAKRWILSSVLICVALMIAWAIVVATSTPQ